MGGYIGRGQPVAAGGNSVETADIIDDAVTNAKIATDAVTGDSIASNAVGNSELSDNAVNTAEIADDAVTADKIANSINTEIAANTAKTGITTAQASAITANTAKVTNSTSASDLSSGTLPSARLGTITGFTSTGIDDNADATAITINSSEKVGIGTTAPAYKLDVSGGHIAIDTLAKGLLGYDGTTDRYLVRYISGGDMEIGDLGSSNDIVFKNSGNVGIGVSNPSDYYAKDLVVTGPSEGGITIASTGNHTNYLLFADSTSGVARYAGMVEYAHNLDAMSFRTNSIQRMTIDSSGNLGVGLSSPIHRLHIYHSSTGAIPTDYQIGATTANENFQGIHNANNSATFSGLALETRTNAASRWLIANEWQSNYSGDLVFRGRDGGTTSKEAMRLKSSGNVGIGTTSPARALHVKSGVGTAQIESTGSTSTLYFGDTASSSIDNQGIGSSGNNITVVAGGSERMRIDSSGNVGIGRAPTANLDLYKSGQNVEMKIEAATNNTNAYFTMRNDVGKQLHMRLGGSAVGGTTWAGLSGSNQASIEAQTVSSFTIGTHGTAPIIFVQARAEKMRIDSSGRVTMPYQPAFLARGLSSVTTNGNSFLFNSVSFDRTSSYNTSNGRFTAPVAGVYLFTFSSMGNSSDSRYMCRLYLNGSNYAQSSSSSNSSQYQDGKLSILINLAVSDYVHMHNSGPKVPYSTSAVEQWFSGHLVG